MLIKKFIDNTCQKTQNATLCESILYSSRRSFVANTVAELAGNSIDIANDDASHIRAHIRDLVDLDRGSPLLVEALKKCLPFYEDAVVELSATRAKLDLTRFGAARSLAILGSSAAFKCAGEFTKVASPLTEDNQTFLGARVVSSHLISLLVT